MIKQTIGYDREELESLMRHLQAQVDELDWSVTMMEEQGLGLRNNLDWKSSARGVRFALEKIKNGISRLGVSKQDRVVFRESDYEAYYLPAVVDRYVTKEYSRHGDI